MKSGVTGLLIGLFCYLLVRMTQAQTFTDTRFNIITILVASFITGVISQMIGNEKISAGLTYLIHFGLISVIFLGTFYVNGWINSWHGLLIVVINFLVIYLLVWLGIIVWNKASAKEINKQLNKFNQK
ncbi:DUF3021 domain-containing protein [Fructilactobacillus sanfranciscensis]|nr:DUF3021 domain-containing protein [Fructilactobacillus sanfranciscensis]